MKVGRQQNNPVNHLENPEEVPGEQIEGYVVLPNPRGENEGQVVMEFPFVQILYGMGLLTMVGGSFIEERNETLGRKVSAIGGTIIYYGFFCTLAKALVKNLVA